MGIRNPKASAEALWKEIDRFLRDTEAGRRPLAELYDRLRRPPFGIKDGPLPVIVVAALLARDDDVAVYERGSFMPAWTPSHAERLLRSPDGFEIRRCRIDGLRRTVFTRLAETLRLSTGREPALLDVVRGLLRFVASLTPYARRTLRISQQARDIREALVRAREPAQLVFDELPAACGCPPFGLNQVEASQRVDEFVGALEAGLRELRNAYPALIERACAVLAEQLSLPRASADLAAELRSRARHLEDVAVDPMLKSFVLRASDEALAPDDLITSLLTQLASKPPHEWADADEDHFEVRAAQVARAFRSAESLVVAADGVDGGQGLLRLAVARRGHPERDRVLPLRSADEARIAALRDRILDTVRGNGSNTAACDRDPGARRAGPRRGIADRRFRTGPAGEGQPVSDRVRHILSMSGGKDSTALAVYMRDREPNMEYVFCDTKKELQETYDYLDKVEAYLGKRIHRLNDERGFDHWLEVYGHYLPSPQMRWCTRQLKIRPFERFVGDDRVISYIGIRGDEQRDGYISSKPNITPRYPFKEDGIAERDVYRILDESGLGVPDYYKWRTRSGCYFCFFQRKAEWLGLKDNHPQLFQDAKAYEKTDPETGRRFTWSQSESLDELASPERADQIRRRHLRVLQAEKASRPDRPLIEVFAESLDQENDEEGCLICHL